VIGWLAWLGRHGSLMLPIGIFLGLLAPTLASLMKPLLIPGIIGPFLIALVRLDWARMADHLRRPSLTLPAVFCLLIAAPFLVHACLELLSLDPALHGYLVLMAAASPLMGSASLALIIGLDASLAVVLTILSTALLPVTLPPIALLLLGIDIRIGGGELMLRLGLLIGGCFLLALLIRRFLPVGFAARHAASLDGLAIIGLLVFGIAIMDGVTALLLDRPEVILATALPVFGLNIGLQALTTLAFAWRGLPTALSIGLCSGNRNLGILLAAMADRVPVDFLIIVALGQLPIYTLPMLQRWLYRRWLKQPKTAPQPPRQVTP
jgi:BASS family bile acid:Na+ symporter